MLPGRILLYIYYLQRVQGPEDILRQSDPMQTSVRRLGVNITTQSGSILIDDDSLPYMSNVAAAETGLWWEIR